MHVGVRLMANVALSKWLRDNVPVELLTSSAFKFLIDIDQDTQVVVDLTSNLDVDYDHIKDQLTDMPSVFVFWTVMYSELKAQCALLQRAIKCKRGKLIDSLNKKTNDAGVKLTDKQFQMILEGDDDLNELENKLIIMEKQCGKLYGMIDAMRMKSDSLRSLAGFAKIDYGNNQ